MKSLALPPNSTKWMMSGRQGLRPCLPAHLLSFPSFNVMVGSAHPTFFGA
jgi:hypothetical protein